MQCDLFLGSGIDCFILQVPGEIGVLLGEVLCAYI